MPNGDNISFVEENGAHGGPGTAETDAFVLVPAATRLTTPARGFLRPEDFRDAALAEMDARRDTPVAGLAPA